MDALTDPVERVAADTGFSGVGRVARDGEVRLAKTYDLPRGAPRTTGPH